MNKKRLLPIIAVFFLVQIASPWYVSQAQNTNLTPPILIADHYFKEIYAALSVAIAAYKSDVVDGDTSEEIINKHGSMANGLDIKFDFKYTDMFKKGWTRYYPVVINSKRFIVRIFLTKEMVYQLPLPVLFEMEIRNPAVTCQISADINSILGKESIEPYRPSFERQTAKSL